MDKKNRCPIPSDIAAEVLFLSDRTCCVCNERGKTPQIHHIDEDPSNNLIDNLSVLCLECHNETMIKGGFGRKLDASQILKYRDEWLDRVKKRKAKADEIASIQTVTGSTDFAVDNPKDEEDYLDYKLNTDPNILKDYLDKIVAIHNAQLTIAQYKWNTGVTLTMNQANYDMIDFYEEILIELSTFYPKGHFKNLPPKEYFNRLISDQFQLHRLILEPDGIGTGGTMVSTITGGIVMTALKGIIVDMVNSLAFPYEIDETLNIEEWRAKWLDK